MKKIKVSEERIESLLNDMLGEGLHTAFRKASDTPQSFQIWKLIQGMPDKEWRAILDFVSKPVARYITEELSKE